MTPCKDFTCGAARAGAAYTPDQCPRCWSALHVPALAASLGRVAVPAPAAPCNCKDCPDCARPTGPGPLSVTRVGPDGLRTTPGGHAFNGGLLRFRGKLLVPYRTGWAGSEIEVAEVDEGCRVLRSTRLHLRHERASYGREDPRLFVHRDRLHVSFTGVEPRNTPRGPLPTSVLYARLTDDLEVERVYYPDYCRRTWPQEKNWVFFEDYAGALLAVYSVAPHVILRVDGDHVETLHESATRLPWSGGHLRGGASPVRVGDRWYHWFHGRVDPETLYTVGCYAFEARPPFKVIGLTPHPLMWANPAQRDGNYCGVRFPAGAILDGRTWKVAMGWNDRSIRVAEWDAAAVDAAMGL